MQRKVNLMAAIRVPYQGGPFQYRDGEQQFEEYDSASDEFVEGALTEINPNLLDSHEPDGIERYVLTRTDGQWALEYQGWHERPLAPGEQPRPVTVNATTRVADGPNEGGIVVIVDFDANDLQRYNSLAYKKTRFGDKNAEHYTLEESTDGWRWIWTRPQSPVPNEINTRRLEQIEGQLANDVLTDYDLATALHDAGLPELGRVVARFARYGQPR